MEFSVKEIKQYFVKKPSFINLVNDELREKYKNEVRCINEVIKEIKNLLQETNTKPTYETIEDRGKYKLKNKEINTKQMYEILDVCEKYRLKKKHYKQLLELLWIHIKTVAEHESYDIGKQMDIPKMREIVQYLDVNFDENYKIEPIKIDDDEFLDLITKKTIKGYLSKEDEFAEAFKDICQQLVESQNDEDKFQDCVRDNLHYFLIFVGEINEIAGGCISFFYNDFYADEEDTYDACLTVAERIVKVLSE